MSRNVKFIVTIVALSLAALSCHPNRPDNNQSNLPSPTLSGSPSATLTKCTIKFHTNNDDKLTNTRVMVTIKDSNNVAACGDGNISGLFTENSDDGPFPLSVSNASQKDNVHRGNVTIGVDPNGHDTWRSNFFLDLQFSDGSHLSGGANGLQFAQDHWEQSFKLDGILK